MNLFTRNSPYYHLLKYLLFLLKHPVYTRILPLRIVARALLRPGKFVLCAISWRVKRYARTGCVVLDLQVPTVHVSRQGFDLSCHPPPSDIPGPDYRTRESETQYGYFRGVWDVQYVYRCIPRAYRHGFGFSDVQTSTRCPFIGP